MTRPRLGNPLRAFFPRPRITHCCDLPQQIQETIMSDITDKLDAAVNAAIAKIQAAGDVTALNAQITQLTADKAALQADLDAANADAVKNTDALNAVTAPAPAA